MSDGPDVSIVMPIWRPRLDWLRLAVRSALAQRDCEIEVIAVDDGSPEPAAELLAEIADPRLRVIRAAHGGASHARNAGIGAARGRFLRFVDADDVIEPGSTARLMSLAGDGRTIAYGSTLVCDEELRPLEVKRASLEGWIAEECLLYRFEVRHMSMLFPRWLVDAVGEWEEALPQVGDWDFVLRALERAPVRGEQKIATYYRRHPTSLSADVTAALRYQTQVVDRYFERHPEQARTRLEREARAKLLIVAALARPLTGLRRREQLRLLARALLLHPRRALQELSREAVRVGARMVKGPGGALRRYLR